MRVAIADNGEWLRNKIAQSLRGRGVEVVASVSGSTALLAALQADPVDAAIIDMDMPTTPVSASWAPELGDDYSPRYEGLRVATEVHRRWPDTGVLILTNHPDLFSARYVDEDMDRGRGYWTKDAISEDDDLLIALADVAAARVSFEPVYREKLDKRRSPLIERLTPREREILELMRNGTTSPQAIAHKLHIAPKTVKTHKEKIYQTLEISKTDSPDRSSDESTDSDPHGYAVRAVLMLERHLTAPQRPRDAPPE